MKQCRQVSLSRRDYQSINNPPRDKELLMHLSISSIVDVDVLTAKTPSRLDQQSVGGVIQ